MPGPYDFWLLDLDGTVVDVEPSYIHEVMGRVGDRLGVDVDAAAAEGLWYEDEHRRTAVLDGLDVDRSDFWAAYHDIENPEKRAAATYLYDDAAATVPEIAGPVGIVTHCQPRLTDAVLDRLDIGDWFDTVVCCGDDVGWKPDPRPVEHAMAALGVGTTSGAMAGDAATDVGAARAAGLDAIRVDRVDAAADPAEAHRRIAALSDLG
jgi:phosphoglycolate phosphatase